MSCDPRVVETQISTIIAQVDEPCCTVAASDTETAVLEQLIPGPQGPIGPIGPPGESYFWEPEASEDLAPGQPCAINSLGQARIADATDSTKPAPRLTTGRIPSTEDEWAWAECNDVSSTVCMRVQMGATLTDAPTVVRSTHGGTGGGSDAPIGLEFEHSVHHDGRFYWPSDFGAVRRTT